MQTSQDIRADLSRASRELWRAAGRGAVCWLGKADGLGMVLSDGCCWAGPQVLRVKSIILPHTETVLDTIWSCSYSKRVRYLLKQNYGQQHQCPQTPHLPFYQAQPLDAGVGAVLVSQPMPISLGDHTWGSCRSRIRKARPRISL